jgi:hypothetical protein
LIVGFRRKKKKAPLKFEKNKIYTFSSSSLNKQTNIHIKSGVLGRVKEREREKKSLFF